jgi:hypothetical protein
MVLFCGGGKNKKEKGQRGCKTLKVKMNAYLQRIQHAYHYGVK